MKWLYLLLARLFVQYYESKTAAVEQLQFSAAGIEELEENYSLLFLHYRQYLHLEGLFFQWKIRSDGILFSGKEFKDSGSASTRTKDLWTSTCE